MLEGLISWFLNNYLGKYLENVDTHQLSVSLLQGQVDLENVPFRRDALRFIEPSIEVRSGMVGHIKLSIPVSRMRSEPWSLLLEKVSIVLGPQKFEDYDEETDEQVQLESKLQALDGIEAEWRAAQERHGSSSPSGSSGGGANGAGYYPAYSSWLSFGASYITTILENLQVQIRDVHIRYEDDISLPGHVFNVGFNLKSLVAQTCDENRSPRFVLRDASQGELEIFKTVDVLDMCAYLDTATMGVNPASQGSSDSQAVSTGKAEVDQPTERQEASSPTSSLENREYLLEPVSANTFVRLNRLPKPLTSRKQARILGTLDLNTINLQLSDLQYQRLIAGGRSLHLLKKARKYWRWRPLEEIHGNAKAWWQYAITCTREVIRKERRTKTKEFMLNAARDNIIYVEAFIAQLESPGTVPEYLKDAKDLQDKGRTYEELKVLRELAVARLKLQMEARLHSAATTTPNSPADLSPVAPEGGGSYLGSWFLPGWYSTQQPTPEGQSPTGEVAPSQREEDVKAFLQSIHEDSDIVGGISHKDVVFSHFAVNLKQAGLKLISQAGTVSKLGQDQAGAGRHHPVVLFECEFNEVKLKHESRPRTKSLMMGLSVGAVILRDKVTKNSLFPLLVSPQDHEHAPLHPKYSQSRLTELAKYILPSYSRQEEEERVKEPLLDVLYEQRPFHSNADYKIRVKSQPLDIVFNPNVAKIVQEFFRIPEEYQAGHLSDKIKAAALHRLEEAKQRTREEFARNINQMLSGNALEKKVWDVVLDLSAPKLIIPDAFDDKQAPIMVIDFGKFMVTSQQGLKLSNRQGETEGSQVVSSHVTKDGATDDLAGFSSKEKAAKEEVEMDDDEDEFLTPASSPVPQDEEGKFSFNVDDTAQNLTQEKSPKPNESKEAKMVEEIDLNSCENLLYNKMYDRYRVDFNNMQIIVGKVRDNWKTAHSKGNSTLHVVDRFSISIQFDRRTVTDSAADPTWPRVAVQANLPRLVLHFNEDKVAMLKHFVDRLLGPKFGGTHQPATPSHGPSAKSQPKDVWTREEPDSLASQAAAGEEKPDQEAEPTPFFPAAWGASEDGVKLDPNARLLVGQFSVSEMSVDIQSQSRPVAELQLTNLKAGVRRKPYELNVCWSVQSLLLVDAMTTLGEDYELLLASHCNVTVDSVSGSLRGSEPMSPGSPGSPPTAGPYKQKKSPTHTDITKALSGITADVSSSTGGTGAATRGLNSQASLTTTMLSDSPDPNALITVEITMFSADCPNLEEEGQLKIVSIQFNSLDIIANQETIIELIGFHRRVFPANSTLERKSSFISEPYDPEDGIDDLVDLEEELFAADQPDNIRTQITAEFQRLNILLLRAGTGKRIGTALLTDARVTASLAEDVNVTGGLGGLQIINLLSSSAVHQRIVSVGREPLIEEQQAELHDRLYSSPGYREASEAFKFEMNKKASGLILDTPATEVWEPNSSSEMVEVSVNISSVVYTHSVPFLEELSSCATDFKKCMANLATSITQAATEMALGIVQRRTDHYGKQHQQPAEERSIYRSNLTESSGGSLLYLPAPAPTPRVVNRNNNIKLQVFATLETPVVVFPRKEKSLEVLVAHLGRMTVTNQFIFGFQLADDHRIPSDAKEVNRFTINVSHINLYSLDIVKKLEKRSIRTQEDQIQRMGGLYLFESSKHGIPILHDTDIEITADWISRLPTLIASESYSSGFYQDCDNSIAEDFSANSAFTDIHIAGRVINPLKVSLSRNQYEQVMETLSRSSYSPQANQGSTSSSSGVAGGQPADHSTDYSTRDGHTREGRTRGRVSPKSKKPKDAKSSKPESNQPSEADDPEDPIQDASPTNADAANPSVNVTQAGGASGSTKVSGMFQLPLLSLELRRDAINADIEPGILSLTFTDFSVTYDGAGAGDSGVASTMDIALKGLVMEDLLLPEDSPHRNLMESSALQNGKTGKEASTGPSLSTSFPKTSSSGGRGRRARETSMHRSSSLPEQLDTSVIFGTGPQATGNIRRVEKSQRRDYAARQHCREAGLEDESTNQTKLDDNLVNITVTNLTPSLKVDPTKSTINKLMMIDFNSLDINFNLETWVVILDFFGIGSGGDPHPDEDSAALQQNADRMAQQAKGATELEIIVRSLSVSFNSSRKALFRATMLDYSSKTILSGDFSMEGQLGNFCIKDLTPHGALYRDRFLCRGHQILRFKIFRYGQPDPDLTKEYEMNVDLDMASMTYVHTQRFFSTIVDFFYQFQRLQATMNAARLTSVPRSRNPSNVARSVGTTSPAAMDHVGSPVANSRHATPSSGHRRDGPSVAFKPPEFGTTRGSRVKLTMRVSEPLLVLPLSSTSSKVLMIDLASLDIQNQFRFAGDEGTISASKLSNLRSGELGGRRSRAHSGSRSSHRSRSSRRSNKSVGRGMSSDDEFFMPPFKQIPVHKCLLDVIHVQLKNLDLTVGDRLSAFIQEEAKLQTDVGIGSCLLRRQDKPLLMESCELKLQIERNLDKGFSHNVPDLSIKGLLSKVHAVVDGGQYEMIRGLLAYNLGEAVQNTPDAEDLLGPAVPSASEDLWTSTFMDIELQNVTVDMVEHHEKPPHQRESGLVRINFIKSRLVYESFSDFSKDVDLVSQEILLHDRRFVDYPANKRANVFTCILAPMVLQERTNQLQAEIHFRSTTEVNRFTILLNNMRLMCVLDWWLQVLNFISRMAENPQPTQDDPHKDKVEVTKDIDLSGEPLYPTSGVITRRNPVIQTSVGPVFELKLNITDSELVIIADTSQSESSAVILRSTTVLAYRPAMKERPLSCNLNNAEVFSCVLGKESETALSIIDPVTVNLEIWGRGEVCPASKGLLDISADSEPERMAEIQLQQLNIRLSYHDAIMFRHILNSLPKQAQDALAGSGTARQEDQEFDRQPVNIQNQIRQLCVLGFSTADSLKALKECGGQMDEAAIWLTQNATLQENRMTRNQSSRNQRVNTGYFFADSDISFSMVQLKTSCINLVIIDDCKDADCPLIKISASSLHLKQHSDGRGELETRLASSYYNRELSAWEPCLEDWKCSVDWTNRKNTSVGTRTSVAVKSKETINVNITSSLLELYHVVKNNWGEDYYNMSREDPSSPISIVKTPPAYRRRVPFIPYALKNNTGCALWFKTMLVNTNLGTRNRDNTEFDSDGEVWKQVKDGETHQFAFKQRSKMRHDTSGKQETHQIIVRVEGWKETKPVSADRVGIYFRDVKAERTIDSLTEIPPARLVFHITLEGSAMKLITVRSALELENKLNVPLRLKLENTALRVGDVFYVDLPEANKISLPLLYCWANIRARPIVSNSNQWTDSAKIISWCHILHPSANTLDLHESNHSVNKRAAPYRFCVAVQRLGYPMDLVKASNQTSSKEWVQPAHRITFLPPLTLINLLPVQLTYSVQGEKLSGEIAPGKDIPVLVNISNLTVIDFSLDNFPGPGSLILQPDSGNFEAIIKLTDSWNRPLQLHVRVNVEYGGALRITVYAKYWLVNRTGLPLVFKQEGEKFESAGQYTEHEEARMIVPLLFHFPDTDNGPNLVIRVGNQLHKDGSPKWCKQFAVHAAATGAGTTAVRRLYVSPSDQRPEWVYNVGVDIRPGRGSYRITTIVTIWPRFMLYNESPYMIQFTQHFFATSIEDPHAEKIYLTAHPKSSLAFHWPRPDLNPLLCLRLLLETGAGYSGGYSSSSASRSRATLWSGGFEIEKVGSFQLCVRPDDNHQLSAISSSSLLSSLPSNASAGCRLHILRVEISLVCSTFAIVVSASDNFPPPFRVDNFSEVPILFHQTGVEHCDGGPPVAPANLRTTIRPHQSMAYALDSPLLPPHITLSAPGASSQTYNMNVDASGRELTYENFIYIAFRETFVCGAGRQHYQAVLDPMTHHDSEGVAMAGGSSPTTDDDCRELVLDVPEGSRVVLSRKSASKRSQLWRMTSTGMLQHEGSSPPMDPAKRAAGGMSSLGIRSNTSSSHILVLDISGPAVQPDDFVPLMLRKPDSRRSLTQLWRFTEDGRLCCRHSGLYVQAANGFLGLRAGQDAVLGPDSGLNLVGRELGPEPEAVEGGGSGRRVPAEQSIVRQRLRPGSGFLGVRVETEGPTRVLRITDLRQQHQLPNIQDPYQPIIGGQQSIHFNPPAGSIYEAGRSIRRPDVYEPTVSYRHVAANSSRYSPVRYSSDSEDDLLRMSPIRDVSSVRPPGSGGAIPKAGYSATSGFSSYGRSFRSLSQDDREADLQKQQQSVVQLPGELHLVIDLEGGVGVSLVTNDPGEELLYIHLRNIKLDYESLATAHNLDGSVQEIQVDCQVPDCQMPIVLYLSPTSKKDEGRHLPALVFNIKRSMPASSDAYNAEIFRHVIISVKNLTLNLEEELIYKLSKFFTVSSVRQSEDKEDEDLSGLEMQLKEMVASSQFTRYYVGNLQLALKQIKLSVQRSMRLRPDLNAVKQRLNLSLISFEDAQIDLEPFNRTHVFETLPFLSSTVLKHYQDDLRSQAIQILGSTDFLGNPLGFLSDVSEGFSGLVSDGNLGGLFKNVTHGAANSTAKVAGSLSHTLSKASVGETYEDRRLMIRKKHSDSSQQHLVAGLKGFGLGVLGGLTSVITEPVEGAKRLGLSGFVQGVGMGLLGTVTKPAIGVLDLATGAASAVRESSRSANRAVPNRVRLPRVCLSPVGTLPLYNGEEAKGQNWMYAINGKKYDELFIAFEKLTFDQMIVVTCERVVIFKLVEGREKALQTLEYSNLVLAQSVSRQEAGQMVHYLELVTATDNSSSLGRRKSQIRCESQSVCQHISHKITIAKTQYEERRLEVNSEQGM